MEFFGQIMVREMDLAHGVSFGNEREKGFIKPTAQELHLRAIDQLPKPQQEVGSILFQPFQERAAIVQGNAEPRMFLQYF